MEKEDDVAIDSGLVWPHPLCVYSKVNWKQLTAFSLLVDDFPLKKEGCLKFL